MEMVINRELARGTACTQTMQIVLTDDEIEKAYRLRQKYYNKCDLISKLKEYAGDDSDDDDRVNVDDDSEVEIGKCVLTGKKLKELVANENFMDMVVDHFDDALNNNDSYWESFWLTAEYVIEDEIEKEEK